MTEEAVSSESSEHLSGDSVHGFVTVIPLDYSRHRGFLQPPDQYSDFKSRDTDHERVDCLPCGKYTQIEDVSIGYKSNNSYDNHTNHSEWDNVQKVNPVNEQSNAFEQTYQNMKVCVFMMNDLALRMEVEDGANVTVQDLIQSITQEEQLRLPRVASTIFTLWMSSGILELQLKQHHKPLHIRNKWSMYLAKYAHASESRQRRDEPVLSFKRNVFFPLVQEERIKDEKVLELLYAEAKYNILEGRYPCDVSQYIMLGSIQARIELGPYNPQYHTLHFFREQQARFLPSHIRNVSWNSWLRLNGKDSPEVKLLEHYRRLPDRKLHRKYLEFCWSLPYYGSAFFQGQIEQPVRGLKSLITHQDIPVLVGINGRGVFIINNIQYTLLVGLRYEELSWDFAKPSQEDNPDCLPCLFLQFRVVENGTKVSKILQIFSKQAVMMDALITGFVEELKLKLASNTVTNSSVDRSTIMFDNNLNIDGRCIGQMGSWSFSY